MLLAIDPGASMLNRIHCPTVEAEVPDGSVFARTKAALTKTEPPMVKVAVPLDLDDEAAVLEYLRAFGETAYGGMRMDVVKDGDGAPVKDAAGCCHGFIVPEAHRLAGKRG